ncbi:MAG: DUF2868 domain-containing protein [Sphingomicrobium sp.]
MTEDEARHVELVRAVELEDRQATLLTREDRAQAEAHARSKSAQIKGPRADDTYIAARAVFASARLTTRHPGAARLLRRGQWPRWLGVGLPSVALFAGLLANEFGTGKRLNLLAVPLLVTIVWNLLIYVLLLVAVIRRSKDDDGNPLYRALLRVQGLGRGNAEHGPALQRAGSSFRDHWMVASAPLTLARIERTLHFGAALFACGLIGGIYFRGLIIEYRAGWESTFLGPQAVHTLLSIVLGPASWVTDIALPSTGGIAAMRWTGPETGGVNAAPWITLYAVTVLGLVIVPRLMLGSWQAARAFHLERRFPTSGRGDFYIRRLLRNAGGRPGRARITPYGYHPGDETRRRLSEVLRSALGDGAEVRFDEPIDYGEEDSWVAEHVGAPDDDYHILLFTLSATPEEENHGALAVALAQRIATERRGTVLAAVVDETPFRARFAGDTGLEERITGRLAAWGQALTNAAIVPLGVDLSQEENRSLAQRLESRLMPDGAMRG